MSSSPQITCSFGALPQVATFGTFALLYTVTESFILPLTPTSEQSFFRSLLDLALPFMVAYLLLFYIIFGEFLLVFDAR